MSWYERWIRPALTVLTWLLAIGAFVAAIGFYVYVFVTAYLT